MRSSLFAAVLLCSLVASAQSRSQQKLPQAAPAPARQPAQQEDEFARTEREIMESTPTTDGPVGVDLGPEGDAAKKGLHARPPGPIQGGVMKVPHEGAAKGLLRINKDGSYQYRTELRPKSKAMSFRVGQMTPPDIRGNGQITYKTMYGNSPIFAILGEYEYQPFQGFGALGVQLGGGFATAHGNGTLKSGQVALESYDLYIVPLSAFAVYRFEYVRRQWVVPYVNGGGTYFGLAEKRDDDKPMKFAGAMAVGGGGGVHLSISRLDPAGAFALDREYGIADMWLTLEGRVMKGLSQDTDFTTAMFTGGITLDF